MTRGGQVAGARASEASLRLHPYVPRLVVDWLRTTPNDSYREVDGSLAFVDISGFTKLTERLARRGKVGAEEMSDTLNVTFAALLAEAYDEGAGLVKWGGDAVLLLFDGPDHAPRACRAAHRMRARMREVGRLETSAGRVTLRMSVGVHSGVFQFFLVGDPAQHRELLVSGPAASRTAEMEAVADAGQIAISAQTAALLPPRTVGPPAGDGFLLRSLPDVPVVGVQPPKAVDGLDLTTVVPVAIREHLLAQPGDAEHRTIAVAFVQFSGTDALLVESGPAALAEALQEVVANVQQATATHGVTFFETDINRDGGKVMLTAGAPSSHGHDEDRMLRAARQIVDRAGTLPLRVGVNRGPVFSGDFGPFFRKTYSVKGDAINLAARVMGKAAPGEVLATKAVVELSQSTFDQTALPPFLVKGKSTPIDAVRLGPLQEPTSRDAAVPALVGRPLELSALGRALEDLGRRKGGLVRLLGPPGIGKTRLVQELQDRAGELPVIVVACDEYERHTAYLVARRVFRAALGARMDAPAEAVAQRLRARVEANAPDLLPWLPLLGIVVGVDLPPTRETRELDEEFRKGRLEEVAVELLGLLLPTPTVLVVEDVHVIDDASLDLLLRVAEARSREPWLLVVTARADEPRMEPDDGLPQAVLRVGPLTADEAHKLVLNETEHHPLPPSTMAALIERSGGNPLFLRGLLIAARDARSLERLPDTIDDLVTAEIDRLPPAHRRMLRYAAVLGMTVDDALLRQMLDDDGLASGPSAFRPLRVFVQPDGAGRWRFRHALIRDAAYEGLPFRRRRALHDQVGTLLLQAMADPLLTPEPLAMHFHFAGRLDEAWTYCRLAGERARAQYAQAEAAQFLGWAVESGRRAGVPSDDLADTLEALGDVRYLMGLNAEAAVAYRQALRFRAGDPVRQAVLLLKEGRLKQRMAQLPQSLRRLTQGMKLVEGTTTPDALRTHSQLATRYAYGRLREGRFRQAHRWGDLAVDLAQRSGDREVLADAHDVLESVTLWSGEASDVPHGEIALQLYEQIGDLRGQGVCLNNLALRAILEGRWTEGESRLRAAAEIFGQVGDETNLATAVYNQADLLIRQGRIDEAEPLLTKALRVARSVDDEETVALVIRESGKAAARVGRYEEAHESFTEAANRFTKLGEPQEVIDVDAAAAEAYLLEGDASAALLAADAALAKAAEASTSLLPTLHRVRGFALLAGGESAQARVAFETGLALGTTPVTRHEQAFLQAGLARIAAREGDAEAEVLLAESRRTLESLGVRSAPLPPW